MSGIDKFPNPSFSIAMEWDSHTHSHPQQDTLPQDRLGPIFMGLTPYGGKDSNFCCKNTQDEGIRFLCRASKIINAVSVRFQITEEVRYVDSDLFYFS